ncbi:MAG: hypothetical protein K2H76_00605, partial [Muribaculaceae bacterium]|nr:hypothetical protein [Muribaculaceae bacterium]
MNITLLRSFLPVAVAAAASSLGAGAQDLIPGGISSISQTGDRTALHSGKTTSVFNADGTRLQMPVSSGWENSKAPMRSDEADEYSFTYKIIAPEGQTDFKLAAIGMYNPEWQFLMAQYQPEGLYESVYPEKSIESPESLSAGTYELLAWGIVKTGEFSYVGYCTHATVDLNSDSQVVTADFSDCVNRLRINCNQGNGEPFPKFDPEVEGEKRSLSFTGRFAYGEAFYDFSIDGSDDFEMLVNDFPEAGTSFYQASFNYLDFGTMSGTSSGSGIRSPFVTDFEGTIQQKYMKFFNNKTSLSPADKAMTVTSMASGSQTLNVYEMGEGFYSVEYAWNAFCSWIDGTPASEMSVYKDMGLNHEPNFKGAECCFPGVR